MKCAKTARMALGLFIALIWLTGLAITPAVAGNASATKCINLFRQKRFKEAFPYCRQAAEQGDAGAQFNLGLMYYYGQVDLTQYLTQLDPLFAALPDEEKDKVIKTLASEPALGMRILANLDPYFAALPDAEKIKVYGMLTHGQGVKKDYIEAAKWCRKAAEQGNAAAQFFLGLLYKYGKGVGQSSAVAADWFYRAGLSYLKDGKKDEALRCVEAIKGLPRLGLAVPNLFLADKLLAAIYGSSSPSENLVIH